MNLRTSISIGMPTGARFGVMSLISVAVLFCTMAGPTPAEGQQQSWSPTGSLVSGRVFHTTTLLTNGKVLVVGGYGQSYVDYTDTAELSDPETGQWSATGSMSRPRGWHAAVRMTDGRVLVVGGFSLGAYSNPQITAEIYDPDSGTWSAAGSLSFARAGHAATLLVDGRVLVTGGSEYGYWGGGPSIAEVYDPVTNVWSPAGTMNSPRDLHTATLLPDGRVLVAGGINDLPLRSAELYDPVTGKWTVTGDLITVRAIHTATLLHNGKVLVAGGGRADYPYNHGDGVENAELYNPATGQWSPTGSLNEPRAALATALLPNGQVLATGGFDRGGKDTKSAELYDPDSGTWSFTASLNTARHFHTATTIANGKVLVAGGSISTGGLRSTELYDPGFEVPQLTLNSTSYCIGAVWSLVATRSAREAFVRLLGVSNGAAWEIAQWGTTDQDGNFRAGGSMADGTEGTHTLTVEIGGIRSSPFSFAVSNCQPPLDPEIEVPQLTLNSTRYCIGAGWSLMVIRSARMASVRLLGVSNGAPWEIAQWGTTDQDGSFSASGSMAEGTEGTHTLTVEIGGIRSSPFSFAVSNCEP